MYHTKFRVSPSTSSIAIHAWFTFALQCGLRITLQFLCYSTTWSGTCYTAPPTLLECATNVNCATEVDIPWIPPRPIEISDCIKGNWLLWKAFVCSGCMSCKFSWIYAGRALLKEFLAQRGRLSRSIIAWESCRHWSCPSLAVNYLYR